MIKNLDIYTTPYLRNILNALPDGILISNGTGDVLWLNDACEKLSNTQRSKIIGINTETLEKQGVFLPSVTSMVIEKQNTVSTVQVTGNRKYLASGYPIKNAQGKIELIVAQARDITNLFQTSSHLEETQELLNRYSEELRKIRYEHDLAVSNHFFIGKSPAYISVINMVDKLAGTDTTVLITGETGVGKNVIANRIHQLSDRKNEPFIEINCGAIPEMLIESELFGYKKGAFTGANSGGKAGLIKMADKGTLFLDEIGELPIQMQVKFLQFLQEKKFIPIGGKEHQKVDVRIIAATNHDLNQQVKEGKFRSDLFYRLNVLPIKVPSVRERESDIFDLLQFNLEKYNKKHKRRCKLSSEVIKRLQTYDWPGNIRELENLLEYLVVISANDEIQIDDLPKHIQPLREEAPSNLKNLTNITDYKSGKSLEEILETVEQQIIEEAYTEYKTTRKTAEMLGLAQSTLMRRIKKYNLNHKD